MVGNGWNQVDPQQPGFGSKKSNDLMSLRFQGLYIIHTQSIYLDPPNGDNCFDWSGVLGLVLEG